MNTPSSDQQETRKLSAEDMRILALLDREEKRLRARESFQDFIEYMMPDPQDYDNVLKTSYVSKPVHKLMVRWWEEIDSMKSMRSALSVPPQNGKSLHTTIMGAAWSLGRRPGIKIISGTYNETRAAANGLSIRRIIESPRYKEVFPEVVLEKGGKSKKLLTTTLGGYILMAGRGSGITGNPCDIFVIDDPVKDQQEATSTNALQEAWDWFSVTAQQRAHNLTRFAIIHTRWADNDLIGRICDPQHPEHNPERSRHWTWLNVKAFNNEPHIAEIMGITPEDYIWPEKFSPEILAQLREMMGEESFSALYMGRPVPEEGGFFRKDFIQNYQPGELPDIKTLRVYASSDHAVTTKNHSNHSVLLIAGVDQSGTVWLLDCVRKKTTSEDIVNEMIRLMKKWRPLTWFAARDQISMSIGPFLKNRMRAEGVYLTHIEDSSEVGNKMQKAQSIRGMMALGLVRFPVRAAWYADMVAELLRFRGEGDAQDDQVDALGHLGRGLHRMTRGSAAPSAANQSEHKPFTIGWVKAGASADAANRAIERSRAIWR